MQEVEEEMENRFLEEGDGAKSFSGIHLLKLRAVRHGKTRAGRPRHMI
jgi:hypothetical protein